MTQFLLKRFVKEPHTSPAGRSAIGALAGITGIGCNVLLFAVKLLTGLLSGSIAILADAFNNLSDAASSLVTLLGFRLAKRPADSDHPYGHARYEYLAALAVSAMILLLGAELCKSSIDKILHPVPPEATILTDVLLLGAIGLKFWMSRFYRTAGELIHSPALLASSLDSRNDVLTTGAVLICCLIHQGTGWVLDGLAGLGVAIFILVSGAKSLKDTISPLLGPSPDAELVEKLNALVLSHEKVLGVHDLLIHDYGPGQCFASLHAEVSAGDNALHIHDILEDIEEDAMQRLNVHLVIHCDPVVENDPELARLRCLTEQAAAQLDPQFTVHDLHLANHEGIEKLVFDLAVPYEMDCDSADLEERLISALRDQGIDTQILIHMDRT